MSRGKKKHHKVIKEFSDSDVRSAVIDEDIYASCPECGQNLAKGTMVDYGSDEGDGGVWFIRKCICGTVSKYFSSVKIGEVKRWSQRPVVNKHNIKNLVKVDKIVKKPVVVVEKPQKPKKKWWSE